MDSMQLIRELTPGAMLMAGLALNMLFMLSAWFVAEVLPATSPAMPRLQSRGATVLRADFPRALAPQARRFHAAAMIEREAA